MKELTLLYGPEFLRHIPEGNHPECPQRIKGLLESLARDESLSKIPRLALHTLDNERILKAHSRELLEEIRAMARGGSGWIDPDTYYSEKSAETALFAAGGTEQLALDIWEGRSKRGFALVRPPGHHATHDSMMGFCLLNNIALAALAIKEKSPQARIAIIDFDLHHGNGTQDIFNKDPNVLFVSSHRFPFYPGTGTQVEVGLEKGRGTKVNFPLSSKYPDSFFLALYGRVISPIVESFQPDMILVSAGYDGHDEDPMDGFRITTEGYAQLTQILKDLADLTCGKMLFCLEGGYNPNVLTDSVIESIKVLNGQRKEFDTTFPVDGKLATVVESFKDYYSQFFPELKQTF
jgi:acetoin utilization deacetylase AcuC-like enzyme